MFPESIIWCFEWTPLSYVEIQTSEPEKISKEFDEIFTRKWKETFQVLTEDLQVPYEENEAYYDYNEGDSHPAKSRISDGKVELLLGPILMDYCYGEGCEVYYACESLKDTLKELQDKYPDCKISGFVAFAWADTHYGETVEFPIGKEKKIYPQFAEILNCALQGKDLFGGDVYDKDLDIYIADFVDALTEDFENGNFEVVEFVNQYKKYLSEEVLNKLTDIIDKVAEDVGCQDDIVHLLKD